MANPIFLPNLPVTGVSVATAISTSRLAVNTATIQANSGNAASVFVGSSAVLPGSGIELTPGSTLPISVALEPNGINLAQIYFASTSAAAKVTVLAWEA